MVKFTTVWAALVILGIGLLAIGCQPAKESEQLWQQQSLVAGPDVLVRIARKRQFNAITVYLPHTQTQVLDEQGRLIEVPLKTKRLYIKKQKDNLLLAFRSNQADWQAAKRYREIRINSPSNQVDHYKLVIPAIGLNRVYEAKGLHFSIKYNRLAVVNQLPMEMYIARVIPSEMDPDHFTLEALKAQAVVARTWATRNRRRHWRFGYNYCDGPHCQVYRGRKSISRRAENATKMTTGEVITINNKVVDAFYHSTCGGNTVFVHEIWRGRPQAHLSRVEDRWKPSYRAYCARSPYFDWSVTLSDQRLQTLLVQAEVLDKKEKIQDLAVDFVNRSGRVLKVRITTDKQDHVIRGSLFRRIINGYYRKRRMLSQLYDITMVGKKITINGHGLGHGVGMCQWGARGMAQHGFDYRDIISHYFKGTTLKRLYGLEFDEASETTSNSKSDK